MDYRRTRANPAQMIASQGPDDFREWCKDHFECWLPCQVCRSWVTSLDRGLCPRCRRRQNWLERGLVAAVVVCAIVAAAVLGGWWE